MPGRRQLRDLSARRAPAPACQSPTRALIDSRDAGEGSRRARGSRSLARSGFPAPAARRRASAPSPSTSPGPTSDWPEYGRDKGGLRFSPLTQITPANVAELRVAWVYHHGDVSDGSDGTTRTSFNATPIVVDGALYFCTG